MVAGADQVDGCFGQDVEGVFAFWLGPVVQSVAFDAVTRVDEEEVGAIVIGFFAEMVGKGDVVAPVG